MKTLRQICGTIIIAALVVCVSQILLAAQLKPWSGKVVAVSDGDTVSVMREGRAERIRLAEIDCPERYQPFGSKSKRFTSHLCFGKVVLVKPETIDKYGRIVAHIFLPDGHNLSEDLISSGLAWHYKEYSSSEKLADLENEARAAKLGIWSEKNPIPPWQWRHGNKQASKTVKEANSLGAGYHGNVRSRIFHQSSCRYFNCGNCTATFGKRDDAIKSGYKPCKICKP